MVTSDFRPLWPFHACAVKICNKTLIYGRIAEIFASKEIKVEEHDGRFAHAQPKLCNIMLINWRMTKLTASRCILTDLLLLIVGRNIFSSLVIASANVNRFSNSFTDKFQRKFCMQLWWRFPLHLNYIATLPCEMWKFKTTAKLILLPEKNNLFYMKYSRFTALLDSVQDYPGEQVQKHKTRKVKPICLDLLEQETVSGTGISWAICKFAHRRRQIILWKG